MVVGKVYRSIGRIVGYGAAVLVVLVAIACARLLFAPIHLDFLRERVAQHFDTAAGKLTVGAEHISLEWGGLREPIRLVFGSLHVTNDSGQTIATAPEVALSFEPRNALRAVFLPTAIIVDRPVFAANITREGGILQHILADDDSSSQSEVVDLLVGQLLDEPNYKTLLGQLDTVRVEHAQVAIRDVPSHVIWAAKDVQALLKRDQNGVVISAVGHFDNGGGPVGVSLSGIYARDRSSISVEARIDELKPAMLALLSPDLAVLKGIDIALSGRLNIEASGAGDIHSMKLDISGAAGTLTLPGILPAPHEVRAVSALASVDVDASSARIDHISIDLGTAQLSLSGVGTHTPDGQSFNGRAELKHVPVDRLADYWPEPLAPGGRTWAIANLSHGTVDVAAEFGLSAPGDDLSQVKVERAVAQLGYAGMTLLYMPGMPALNKVSGTARFEGAGMHFDVAHGESVGLTVTDATIDLGGLDDSIQQTATLNVPITGTAAATAGLLARPRLGLPKEALYDPKRLGGAVSIDLSLAFPLVNTLEVSDIDIHADATLNNVSLKEVIGAVDLTEATGHVVYGNSQLEVTGTGKFDGNPLDIVWREQFGPKVSYRQRYELKGILPAAVVGKAGFPSPEPFVTGPINITSLIYQAAPNGSGEVSGKFDLKGAHASLPQVGWTKQVGVGGRFGMSLKLAAGGKLASAEFEASSNGLAAKGGLRFGAASVLEQVTIPKLSLDRTDMSIDWRRSGDGVDIDVRGRSVELSKLRRALEDRDDKAKPADAADKSREQGTERTRLAVRVDQLLTSHGTLGSLSGRVALAGDRLNSAELSLTGGKGATFRVQPAAGSRAVALYVADFGTLLRETGWLDGLAGGYLDFRGRFEDAAAGDPLVGTLKLGPYRLQKVTPRKDVGSFNSTIDSLDRAGDAQQQFDGLEAQIRKVGEQVDVREGRTSGKSIGLTAAGRLDLENDTARLHGVVVPAFELNNLLANVPLLGPLITGGKGAGLFAISYRLDGPFDDLKSEINLLSAVTPGVLRELLGELDAPELPAKPK